MSIYDKASLVLIPSGTKTSKVYSQKPVNGDGDFTFSRSTAATRVNADGNIEKETQNLLLQSNSFDTTWTASSINVTGGQSGYDGSSDAWLISKSASHGHLRQNNTTSGVKSLSVYAKEGSSSWIRVRFDNSPSGDQNAWINLNNGSIGTSNAIAAYTESIGSGWYRVVIQSSSTDLNNVRIYPAEANESTTSASGNIYIQDAQLEQGLVARDYIETTTAAVEGGITDNVPRLDYTDSSCPALLLEPQRTNAVAQSEYLDDSSVWSQLEAIVTPNEAISPEGVQNASKLLCVSGFANHQIDGTNISISSGAVTGSVFAKKGANADWLRLRLSGTSNPPRAWFDLENGVVGDVDISGTATIEDYGNGWYRCSLTEAGNTISGGGGRLQIFINKSDGQTQFTSNGDEYHYIYGAQLEAGSYATSYIPTYGTSVTRNGEDFNISGMESNGIFGSTAGTIFLELNRVVSFDSTEIQWNFRKSDNGNMIRLYYEQAGDCQVFRLYNGLDGEFIIDETTLSYSPKIAISYDGTSRLEVFGNGSKITKTGGNFSSNVALDKLVQQTTAKNLTEFGSILFFPTALTDAECIALTTI